MSLLADTATIAPLDPRRRAAWAHIGTPVQSTGSAHEALVTAGLAGWNIRKVFQRGSEITPEGVTTIDNPEQVMLVYSDPARNGATRYLSTVGKGYGVHQNEEGAAVIDTLVAESGARGAGYAGQLAGGKRTFVTIELPTVMRVDGVDAMELHLVVFSSHDGSSAFRVMIVPFRPICANQQNIAIANHVSAVSIRHTSKSKISVAEIRSKLGLLYEYADAFEREAQQLIRTQMTRDEFADLAAQVWPVKATASARTVSNARRRTGALMRLWTDAQTQAPVRGTRYAAFQAVTEYLDHVAPAKNELVRAARVLGSDDVAKYKQHAFDLLAA